MTTGRLRYLAYLSEDPDMMADFYIRHLELEELGRSNEGDVSLTDGFYNITFLKARMELGEPDNTIGLHHVGLQVDDMDRVITTSISTARPGARSSRKAAAFISARSAFTIPNAARSLFRPAISASAGKPCATRAWPISLTTPSIPPLSSNSIPSCSASANWAPPSSAAATTARTASPATGSPTSPSHPYYNGSAEGHEQRFGVNHIGFLVNDIEQKLENFAKETETAPRPAARPYAEYRVRDPEGNGVDLSKTKGWEIGLGKWENAA